jgi:hypothetical protein
MLPLRRTRRGVSHGDLRDDDRILVARLEHVVEERRRGAEDRTGALLPSIARLEHEQLLADLHVVAIREPVGRRERAAVEQRAVATAEILDRGLAVLEGDGCVLPAHRRGVDHDVARGMATDDHTAGTQGDAFAGSRARFEFESGHEKSLGSGSAGSTTGIACRGLAG